MRILICDDDPLAIEQIHKNLKSFFTYKHIKCPEVISYSCGEDLLNDTGNKDIVFLDIEMPGLTGLEGHGVSYCAACDAFFYRGKDVAVLGSGEYALHEVQALLPVVKSVTLLTNGAALTADFPPEVTVCTQKVEAILGEQTVTGVQLADGAVREVSGVFVALGVACSSALAR